jgi:hypothetical protein
VEGGGNAGPWSWNATACSHFWAPHPLQEEAEAAAPLQLLGLAAMENPLRDDSAEVILKLQTARIRCVMVTGDHVRTAISVAHHCRCGRRPLALPAALWTAAARWCACSVCSCSLRCNGVPASEAAAAAA